MISYSTKPVFIYLMDAYGYFAPGIASMFLLGIFWKGATQAGALASGALTVVLSLALDWIFPNLAFANRTGIVFWACMVIGYLVSLAGKLKSEEELKGLIWTLQGTRAEKHRRSWKDVATSPVVWWTIVTIVVILFTFNSDDALHGPRGRPAPTLTPDF